MGRSSTDSRGAARRVQLSALGAGAEAHQASIRERLRVAGVRTAALGDRVAGSCVIVVVGRFEPEVIEHIADVRRAGAAHILVIAVDGPAVVGDQSWNLLAAGASDVLRLDGSEEWPSRVAGRIARWSEVSDVVDRAAVSEGLAGESSQWRAALSDAVEAARFTDAPVLITGETGTGKERVAQLMHSLSPVRGDREMVVVDCTTIVPTLSGSEFFGHERGAFTGAVAPRDGAFALADRSTLFLDEVGELPIVLQGEILRVVQEGIYKRVGSNQWRRTSFRLICATNRDLLLEAGAGRFRHDLLYRIAGLHIRLPSLRERPDDILRLARHFLRELCGEAAPELDPSVSGLLLSREYPGNVRDLRQLMARIAYRHVGPGPVTVGELPQEERPVRPFEDASNGAGLAVEIRRALERGATLRMIGALATEAAISVALEQENGNVSRAARRLGVTPRALQLRRAASRRGESANGNPAHGEP